LQVIRSAPEGKSQTREEWSALAVLRPVAVEQFRQLDEVAVIPGLLGQSHVGDVEQVAQPGLAGQPLAAEVVGLVEGVP
jgi:hypothetical protein